MAISTSPIPTTPAELDAIKRRLQDPTIDISKLQQYATGSVATIPGYLALGELSRRNSLIQNQQAQNANPAPPTILQQQAQQAQAPQAPQQGIAQGMPPGAPPPQGGQMPPQAPPQMSQMPPKPVAAAGGGLMQLPMRSDMFRRSDYAHGGVIHFNGTDESRVPPPGAGLLEAARNWYENLVYGKNIYRPSKLPNAADAEDQRYGESINKKPVVVEDPNAGMRILPNAPAPASGGEGSGGGINKETAKLADPAIQYINKYLKSEDPARITQGDYLEGKREQGLDALPKTSTSRLEEIQQSYNRPRTWDENLSLMKQDALRARSGAGFSDTDIGGTARVLDASNREKSIAISLKLEEIENLDRKAQFAHRNGQDDKAREIEIERDKLIAEVQKVKGTVAGQAVQGIAGLARMPNVGGGGGSKTTTLSESTITKAKTNINEFVNSPRLDSEFWDFVPNADAIKEKLKVGKKPGNANYDSAIQDLQKFKSDIYNGYVSDLRGERAVATKKQVK
jgi:hypothetical protein